MWNRQVAIVRIFLLFAMAPTLLLRKGLWIEALLTELLVISIYSVAIQFFPPLARCRKHFWSLQACGLALETLIYLFPDAIVAFVIIWLFPTVAIITLVAHEMSIEKA